MLDALTAEGIEATFEATCGFVSFRVEDQGRMIDMLHVAPWVQTGEVLQPDTAPHLAGLQGDFFCAPFADATAEGAPLHGWPANGTWVPLGTVRTGNGQTVARWALPRPVAGAGLVKEVTLVDRQPFLYQRHIFVGGAGRIPVGNHAMLSLPDGAVIRTSRRRYWETPANPQESDPARGRSIFAYPARTEDATRFPLADGGAGDVTRYPVGQAHEDFVIAVEAAGQPFGWVAVSRPDGTLYLSLRNAASLPVSMFWHSNGGRAYAPWSSRHLGVLGIEEGVGFDSPGFLSDETRSAMQRDSQPTALELRSDGLAEVRHVLGQIAWPSGEPVAEVTNRGGEIVVRGDLGTVRVLPFRAGFLPESV